MSKREEEREEKEITSCLKIGDLELQSKTESMGKLGSFAKKLLDDKVIKDYLKSDYQRKKMLGLGWKKIK